LLVHDHLLNRPTGGLALRQTTAGLLAPGSLDRAAFPKP
jgi:hypothetical protein